MSTGRDPVPLRYDVGHGAQNAGLEPDRSTLKELGSVKIIKEKLAVTLTVDEIRAKYSDTKRRRCKVHMDGYEEKFLHLTSAEVSELRRNGYRVNDPHDKYKRSRS